MRVGSFLFNILFWAWIAVLGLGLLPVCLVYRPFSFTVARVWGVGTLFLLRHLCGITYTVRGREHIPAGAALVASKHQSAWDTVIFWILLEKPAYVLKKALIYFPVFGWYLLLLENIYIDRKSGASAMKHMLRSAVTLKKRNRPIVIFPEGTRIRPSAASVYHPGVAALYQQMQVPVVPVALNSGLCWSRNAFIKKPGNITIEFLPPIAPGMRGRDFMKTLQEQVDAATNALVQTPPPAA